MQRSAFVSEEPFEGRFWAFTGLGQMRILLVVAIALGGGGVAYGLRNLAVQLAALLILFLQSRRVWDFLRNAPRAIVVLALLTMAVPLLQMIPLPAAIWQAMPGREAVVQSFAIAGIPTDSWFPVSVDRGRTLTAFLSLIPPFTILAIGATLTPREKAALARSAGWAAIAALLIGAIQLVSGNTQAMLFNMEEATNVLYATFANRNSTAALFAISLLLLVVVPASASRGSQFATIAGAILLSLGVVMTQSRSGMVLLALALVFVLLRAAMLQIAKSRGGQATAVPGWLPFALGGVLVIGLAAGSAVFSGRIADSLTRFGDTETDRPEMWEDGAYAAKFYWPVGSGMGTFDEVFQIHESLEYVSPRKAGRAHSDVLEVVIEAGIAGTLLLLSWLVWCAQAAARADPYWRWPALGAGAGILLLLAQSLLDYPLRSQTLLCVAAVLLVMLAQRREGPA